MPKPTDALDFLASPKKYPPQAVCVLFGDETFLQRQALAVLRESILGDDDGDFSLSTFVGDDASWREINDELTTVAMFGGRRLVVVDDADDFVSRNRPALEEYAAKPSTTATLVLVVGSWPATTRLYKGLAESGLQIECKAPAPARLEKWLVAWVGDRHHAKLDPAAAEALVESIEPELGLLDQELAKLALLVEKDVAISEDLVRTTVASWRTKTTWDMLDAAAEGNAPSALTQLERLLLAGEAPVAILGQIGSTLRRFAAAARLVEQAEATRRRITLREALEQAGFKSFILSKAEGQLRQIGRPRAGRLYRWLLEADLALKGVSSAPARARLTLEQLIARLSKRAASKEAPAAAR